MERQEQMETYTPPPGYKLKKEGSAFSAKWFWIGWAAGIGTVIVLRLLVVLSQFLAAH